MTAPNILLLYADQLRIDAIHALGNEAMDTPNIDRLIASGLAFSQCTSPSPVCMPARWSLHSGQWTTTHRCWSNHHDGRRPAAHLPGLLREAGFRTGLVGKNHCFLTPDDLDHYETEPPPVDPSATAHRDRWLADDAAAKRRLCAEAVPGGGDGEPDRAVTDAGLRFLDSVGGQPFFLWLSWLHPHTPYRIADPWFSRFADRDPFGAPKLEEGGLEAAGKPFRHQFHRANNDAILPFDEGQVRTMRRVYASQVAFLDHEIGRVLDHLEVRGLRETTQIWFLSDHGDYLGDHGLITKSPSCYDCLVRTPLIASGPGVPAGARSEALVSHVDLMPTLLTSCGIPVPDSVQGLDLGPILSGARDGVRSVCFAEYGIPGRPYDAARLEAEGIAVGSQSRCPQAPIPWEGNPVSLAGRIRMARTASWKLVEEVGGTDELYDLVSDPHELVNRAGRPEHAAVEQSLRQQLADWKAGLPGIEDG